MLDYFWKLCQRWSYCKIIFLLSLLLQSSGCGHKVIDPIRPIDALPQWMKLPDDYAFKDADGGFLAHPFFDLNPFPHKDDISLNFYPVTPAQSPFSYDLDLKSGQLYRVHRFCERKDGWKKFSGTIDRPMYTSGIVPRLLNQLGRPQEVKVFGRPEFYLGLSRGDIKSYRISIVGGLVMQYCPQHPCSTRNSWQSSLILVGVDREDPSFKDIVDFKTLKKKIDWDAFWANIQNEKGVAIATKEIHPAYRIIGQVDAGRSLGYALTKGHLFNFEEMKTLRSGCLKLYDYLWDSAKKVRENLSEAGNKKELEEYKKKLEESRFIKEEYFQETKQDKVVTNLATFFKDFSEKYQERFYTCTRYLRPSNLHVDTERHWFFVQLEMYTMMEKLGYIYLCNKRAWAYNPLKLDNTRIYDAKIEQASCRSRDIDLAFDSAVLRLQGMAQNKQEHARYIEYDNAFGGTHKKMYSWVYASGKEMNCNDKKLRERISSKNIFPEDVSWKDFTNVKHGDLIR